MWSFLYCACRFYAGFGNDLNYRREGDSWAKNEVNAFLDVILSWKAARSMSNSGQPSSIFSSDVSKKVLSVFITAATLKVGQVLPQSTYSSLPPPLVAAAASAFGCRRLQLDWASPPGPLLPDSPQRRYI
ncbi:uncharacterized protein LOC127810409 isoform X3 [Diospyros lotus]|uniref:uncharacterized protein LOC127810409 isoform X3 n=1 Tax=Diospyros lotus TaxID=55363 RepID=UPI00225C16B8|nr:uncharacterized protein LOC127810409 isoform X3 [Diospyros lotus]